MKSMLESFYSFAFNEEDENLFENILKFIKEKCPFTICKSNRWTITEIAERFLFSYDEENTISKRECENFISFLESWYVKYGDYVEKSDCFIYDRPLEAEIYQNEIPEDSKVLYTDVIHLHMQVPKRERIFARVMGQVGDRLNLRIIPTLEKDGEKVPDFEAEKYKRGLEEFNIPVDTMELNWPGVYMLQE